MLFQGCFIMKHTATRFLGTTIILNSGGYAWLRRMQLDSNAFICWCYTYGEWCGEARIAAVRAIHPACWWENYSSLCVCKSSTNFSEIYIYTLRKKINYWFISWLETQRKTVCMFSCE